MKRSSKGEFQELNYLPLAGKDNFDGEIFIFSDIRDIALPNEPLKLDLPIFALCVNGFLLSKKQAVTVCTEPAGFFN